MKAAQTTTAIGRAAEQAACDYLQRRGLKLLARNYRVACGEIDLVMADGAIIVFVEVRARLDDSFMHPVESITARKRRRIIRAGSSYLQSTGHLHSTRSRFDVICVTGGESGRTMEWIRGAFEA